MSESAATSARNPAKRPISVLFVCLGNICRSPMAEAVFRHKTGHLPIDPDTTSQTIERNPYIKQVDSAGTGAYHTGADPDPRTQATLLDNSITTYTHAARKISLQDFATYDWILGMDEENMYNLRQLRKAAVAKSKNGNTEKGAVAEIAMFGKFGGKSPDEEVLDPYYGADDGFSLAYEQMTRFSDGFLKEVLGGEA